MRPRGHEIPELTLYSRPGCHLCEPVRAELAQRAGRGELRWHEVDISRDRALEALHGASIPVLQHAGRTLAKGRFSVAEALSRLQRRAEA